MIHKCSGFVFLLVSHMLLVSTVHAGGVDPSDMPSRQPAMSEKVTATSAQTSAAVSKARQAVSPAVKEVQISQKRPKKVPSSDKDSWMLGSREGGCAPLSAVARKVKKIGTFKTPNEFSRQMQQRGYRAFVLDIGDAKDQVVRVKVPDLDLDLTFMKTGMCR